MKRNNGQESFQMGLDTEWQAVASLLSTFLHFRYPLSLSNLDHLLAGLLVSIPVVGVVGLRSVSELGLDEESVSKMESIQELFRTTIGPRSLSLKTPWGGAV
jgi:hypothetical protein